MSNQSETLRIALNAIKTLNSAEMSYIATAWQERQEELRHELLTSLERGDVVQLHNARETICKVYKINRKTCWGIAKEDGISHDYKIPLSLIARRVDDEQELMLLKLADKI